MGTASQEPLGRRYVLFEELGRGGMGSVFRARDRLSGNSVALKRMLGAGTLDSVEYATVSLPASGAQLPPGESTANNRFQAAFRRSLINEFRLLSSLRHPNIISVLDYGFDQEMLPYFTMELLCSPRPITLASTGHEAKEKIAYLAQLLRALVYLHRRGILHRDIKPSNVLCVGESLKVLDFGIAIQAANAEGLMGTVEYMAPELLLGAMPSVASDLYAVGVVAFEMFTGRFPYSRASLTTLLAEAMRAQGLPTIPGHVLAMLETYSGSDILAADSNQEGAGACLPAELADRRLAALTEQVGPKLAAVIRKLLARRPEQRYQDAAEALSALTAAVDSTLPVETAATRESFLQASDMVGRESELRLLTTAIERAAAGSGSGWLIGGESGVGKSRFLDELRTLALVRGALVLRGQAISSRGGGYQLFYEVLRSLAIQVELNQLEADVIGTVVPDLSILLEREIRPPPELNPQATRIRLRATVEAALSRIGRSVVLILEDLQWADSESLQLIEHLMTGIAARPLLIFGSYRDDEARNIPSLLSGMQLLKLNRLSTEQVLALSESMLGEAGSDPGLIDVINRETEGNAFFIVEVLRALAEEAGALSSVGSKTLPRRIMAGGIKQVIRRRLDRVPAESQPLLRLAAVMGRQLDLPALQVLREELSQWLQSAADAAVLEVHEEVWRFAHDKLREAILEEISPDELPSLHLQAAIALDQAYVDERAPVAALAHHYRMAKSYDKALHFSYLAGQRTLLSGAPQAAVRELEYACQLVQHIDIPPLMHASILRLLLRAQFGLSNLPACPPIHAKATTLLGYPMPNGKQALAQGLLRQMWRQLRNRLGQQSVGSPLEARERSLIEECLLLHYSGILEVHALLGNILEPAYCAIESLNLAERIQDNDRQAIGNAMMGYVFALISAERLSKYYFQRAKNFSVRYDQKIYYVLYKQVIGIFSLNSANWSEATECLSEATDICFKLGDDPLQFFSLFHQVFIEYYLGRYDEASGLLLALIDRCRRHHYERYLTWFQALQGAIQLRRGQFHQAAQRLEAAKSSMQHQQDALFDCYLGGLQALCSLRLGDEALARRQAQETAQRMLKKRFVSHGGLEGLPGLIEVLLVLAEKSPDPGQRHALVKQAMSPLGKLKQFAGSFQIARARTCHFQGRVALLQGRAREAEHYFKRGLAEAEQSQMPYEQALAHAWLARLPRAAMSPGSQLSESHHAAALELFRQLHAEWDIGQLSEHSQGR